MAAPATARLIIAAAMSVPGSPLMSMSTNPASSTPTAAPMLLAKYNSAMARPEDPVRPRIAPAVMSGNVAPRSTDCGTISSAAMAHFATECAAPGPMAGKIESYASCVVATNTS